jgi:hypothetical protein
MVPPPLLPPLPAEPPPPPLLHAATLSANKLAKMKLRIENSHTNVYAGKIGGLANESYRNLLEGF